MPKLTRSLAVSALAAGIMGAGLLAIAPAAVAAPATTCTPNKYGYSTVETADWLRVHTGRSTSSPAVGQLPRGARFCFLEQPSGRWIHGFGYNGSTKLTGYVDGSYLAWP